MTAPSARSAAQVRDVGWVAPPTPEQPRRAALVVCDRDPDHARTILDALGLYAVLRAERGHP